VQAGKKLVDEAPLKALFWERGAIFRLDGGSVPESLVKVE
jgi:hypothetical protein